MNLAALVDRVHVFAAYAIWVWDVLFAMIEALAQIFLLVAPVILLAPATTPLRRAELLKLDEAILSIMKYSMVVRPPFFLSG